MDADKPGRAGLKERAIEEFKLYAVIVLYLWIFLGSFTLYRRFIVAESGVGYVNYGIALIEALIIGKVILIGKLFGSSRRYDQSPLIVPVLYKSLFFGALVFLFGILEHIVKGWFHHEGLLGGLRTLGETSAYEIGARAVMLIVAFVPFFAFAELSRVMGGHALKALFFDRRPAA